MNTFKLITVFTSTYPIDCHILKGRLETEGITCFIYDENIVSVDPFRSVAVGGVKLKVEAKDSEKAKSLISKIENNLLFDEDGEYQKEEIIKNEIERQNKILDFKKAVQKTPELLIQQEKINKILDIKWFTEDEKLEIIEEEKDFYAKSNRKINFSWKQFWYELLDYERSFFAYIYPNTSEFGVEKDILKKYSEKSARKDSVGKYICPKCKSDNVKFGFAVDYKPDILYLVLSLLARAPFFPFRKKYHCFNCGNNFKK